MWETEGQMNLASALWGKKKHNLPGMLIFDK